MKSTIYRLALLLLASIHPLLARNPWAELKDSWVDLKGGLVTVAGPHPEPGSIAEGAQPLLCLLQTNTSETAAPPPISCGDSNWQLRTDPASGALLGIENKHDPHHMDWLRQPGHWDARRNWISDSFSSDNPCVCNDSRPNDQDWALVNLLMVRALNQTHRPPVGRGETQ